MSPAAPASRSLDDLIGLLACPSHRRPLALDGELLSCDEGHTFPVVAGVPVLLDEKLDPTLPDVFEATAARLEGAELSGPNAGDFVEDWIVRTNGNLYRDLRKPLPRYPIPRFPLTPRIPGEIVLDVGGNWGRWALGAAHNGYRVVVVDPNLEATLVGTHIARETRSDVSYVVGDARALPFGDATFDDTFSYSVLQHFDKEIAREALTEMGRVLLPGGRSLVQMPNIFGARQATNRVRQVLARNSNPFRVRYWEPRELVRLGSAAVGPSALAVDGYFSLNPRPEDADLLSPASASLVRASERLRRLSERPGTTWLRWFADSVWLSSRRR